MKKIMGLFDEETGEILEAGFLAYFTPKRRNGFERWLAMSQDGFLMIARNPDMTLSDVRVFHCLLAHADHQNFVMTPQAEMAEKIGMAKSHFNRSLKKLFELGIFEKGPKIGRMVTIKFNPEFGWKGSAKKHVIALDQERQRKMQKAGITGVVDGGRDGENNEAPEPA